MILLARELAGEAGTIPLFVKMVTIVMRITGGLSLMGSLLIFQHILKNQSRRNETYHRLVAMISLSDMCSSFGILVGAWTIPKELHRFSYLAAGNTRTCTLSGFVSQLGTPTTPMYYAALGVYYVLEICYSRSVISYKQIRNMERWMHIIIGLIAIGTAIAGVLLKLYNPTPYTMCWIEGYPFGCDAPENNNYYSTTTQSPCIRGKHAWIYQLAFNYVFVWISFLVNAICMLLVYRKVHRIEQKNDRYLLTSPQLPVPAPALERDEEDESPPPTTPTGQGDEQQQQQTIIQQPPQQNREKSKEVVRKAIYYFLAFAIPWILNTIVRIMKYLHVVYIPKALVVSVCILFPLQGFWNCLIYFRVRYYEYKRIYKPTCTITIFYKMFFYCEPLDHPSRRISRICHKHPCRRRRPSNNNNNNNKNYSSRNSRSPNRVGADTSSLSGGGDGGGGGGSSSFFPPLSSRSFTTNPPPYGNELALLEDKMNKDPNNSSNHGVHEEEKDED